ncbi:tetratricopeptide repeat protein [uncultured Sphaerochaeta sp.]|uniref:tetratricopeptide repeat protein n=1 Tax=uncultured Sphaerochaeta sp. TaxID=886478 RepID=UPI002A0A7C63|nr:tetratricopeptide repeat protein [uncultured Sphaerochaeta sp.]
MTTSNENLKDLLFINLPPSMERDINDFHIDSSIEIPVQFPDGKQKIDSSTEISIEQIIAGMLKIIAYDTKHPHFDYYRKFVLASQPDAVKELNIAAISKEKNNSLDFAEELFLTVNHLEPISATFINLATLYSKRATEDTTKGTSYDFYQQKVLNTLTEGLELLGEDENLLSELGFFHMYQGNIEIAKTYLDRYLEVGTDTDKRKHVQNIMADINNKLNDDKSLMQAYDEIQMNNEEKALSLLAPYLTQNPKVWNGWFLKGWALRRLENFEEAEKAFLTCLSLGETNSDIYNELALCSLEAHNTELAKNYLNTAIDLDGENLTLLSNLAYLHLKDQEWDEAREFLEMARNVDGNDPVILKLMEDYQAASGDTLSAPIVQEFVDTATLKEKERLKAKNEKPFHIPGKEDSDDVEVDFEEALEEEHACSCGHDHGDEPCDCGDDCSCGHHHHEE